jgi:hypothetical protein
MYSDALIRTQNDGNLHASAMATDTDYEGNLGFQKLTIFPRFQNGRTIVLRNIPSMGEFYLYAIFLILLFGIMVY